MNRPMPFDVGGYVLAGGKSSRMGQDKALMMLEGRPLVERAVAKLSAICREVRILGSRPELARYAPLVPDLHSGCGPMGGLEAALKDCRSDWSLFLPVDVPFLPVTFLWQWVRSVLMRERQGCRIATFTVSGQPQPTVCMLHREVRPSIEAAVARRELKLYPVLEAAGRALAEKQGVLLGAAFFNLPLDERTRFGEEADGERGLPSMSEVQRGSIPLWFANLNTPEEFAAAERVPDLLDG